mmetsp:Transcript_41873/g.89211  ORF Transcript_41873/g.89211 Transcript_41873/m.89211 type:complete len:203 (+) Transcript_41873:985-1593(+)
MQGDLLGRGCRGPHSGRHGGAAARGGNGIGGPERCGDDAARLSASGSVGRHCPVRRRVHQDHDRRGGRGAPQRGLRLPVELDLHEPRPAGRAQSGAVVLRADGASHAGSRQLEECWQVQCEQTDWRTHKLGINDLALHFLDHPRGRRRLLFQRGQADRTAPISQGSGAELRMVRELHGPAGAADPGRVHIPPSLLHTRDHQV